MGKVKRREKWEEKEERGGKIKRTGQRKKGKLQRRKREKGHKKGIR